MVHCHHRPFPLPHQRMQTQMPMPMSMQIWISIHWIWIELLKNQWTYTQNSTNQFIRVVLCRLRGKRKEKTNGWIIFIINGYTLYCEYLASLWLTLIFLQKPTFLFVQRLASLIFVLFATFCVFHVIILLYR